MTLFSRLAKPFHRLGCVFGHTIAAGIKEAEHILRIRITLVSGFAKPLHRLGLVCDRP